MLFQVSSGNYRLQQDRFS